MPHPKTRLSNRFGWSEFNSHSFASWLRVVGIPDGSPGGLRIVCRHSVDATLRSFDDIKGVLHNLEMPAIIVSGGQDALCPARDSFVPSGHERKSPLVCHALGLPLLRSPSIRACRARGDLPVSDSADKSLFQRIGRSQVLSRRVRTGIEAPQ